MEKGRFVNILAFPADYMWGGKFLGENFWYFDGALFDELEKILHVWLVHNRQFFVAQTFSTESQFAVENAIRCEISV